MRSTSWSSLVKSLHRSKALYRSKARPNHNLKSSDVLQLSPDSLQPSLLGLLTILTIQLVLVVILITVAFVDIILQPYNISLTNLGRNLYTAVTTLVATLIGIITEVEIRRLWTYVIVNAADKRQAQRRAAVVVGLSSIKDTVRTGYIPTVFLIVGLVTTAIVTGLQPTSMTVIRDLPFTLSHDRNLTDNDWMSSLAKSCHETYSSLDAPSRRLPTAWFNWHLSDDTNLTVHAAHWIQGTADRCPTYGIQSVIETVDGILGHTLPGGIKVSWRAAGFPFDLRPAGQVLGPNFYHYDIRDNSLATWSLQSFEWATVCVPIISRQVVRCEPAEGMGYNSRFLNITSGDCKISRSIDLRDDFYHRNMVAGACTGDMPVGTATVLIGGTNNYASQLSKNANSSVEVFSDDTGGGTACAIDLRDSLTFRRLLIKPVDVNEDQQHLWTVVPAESTPDGSFAEARFEGEECTALDRNGVAINPSSLLTPTALAAGAAASWQLLAENMQDDNYLSTLLAAADTSSAFEETFHRADEDLDEDPIERLLTLASSIALGFHFGSYSQVVHKDMDRYISSPELSTEIWGGRTAHRSVRVGTKEAWAVLFALPSVFVIVFLTMLWWRVQKLREIQVLTTTEEDSGREGGSQVEMIPRTNEAYYQPVSSDGN